MRNRQILLLPVAAMLLASCSGKLGALSADNFTVTPNPLETQAGVVEATIDGVFPEKYMKKKAVVTVTPELRYNSAAGAQAAVGQGATFQGESVLGNDQTISYKVGGRYTMRTAFQYVPDMLQSDLYLTFNARVGKKQVNVPAVKVATGVVATSELYRRTVAQAQPALAADAYQRVTKQQQQANVRFLIGQYNLRKSELQNNSVQEFVRLLSDIAQNQSLEMENIEVSAYASPDGGYDINERLAGNRQDVTANYVRQQLRKAKTDATLDTRYTAEDWEGFQELVAASDIQDKDVILRVLSMYKDPEEREQQIRNISQAFRELADGILPQLRRSRMTINYQVVGRSDEQILAQLTSDPSQLTIEEVLYGANLIDDLAAKKATYEQAVKLFPNDARAYNNVALVEYAQGNYQQAAQWAQRALSVNPSLAEANANLGLLALQQGDVATAETLLGKAAGANGLAEVLGNLHLAQGKYALAEDDFDTTFSNSAALAQLLNKNYASALTTLKYVKDPDATTDYLRALVSNRLGKSADAAAALQSALAKDPTLATYAARDLELQNLNK